MSREDAFELDKQETYRALQDARAYNTDTDRSGKKAEAIYKRLERANRVMYPWSTDGTPAQVKKSIEYLREITSILSEKIGPASRREFAEQGGTRGSLLRGPGLYVTRAREAREAIRGEKTAAQLDREIEAALKK